LVKITSIDEA